MTVLQSESEHSENPKKSRTEELEMGDQEIRGRIEIPEYYCDRQDYLEEFWTAVETCCLSDSSENYQLKAVRRTSWNKFLQQKSHQKINKYQGSDIIWTLRKTDKGGTETDGQVDKEIDDDAQGLILERWHGPTLSVKKRRRKRNC